MNSHISGADFLHFDGATGKFYTILLVKTKKDKKNDLSERIREAIFNVS